VLRQFTWNRAFHAQIATYASLVGAHRMAIADTEILEARSPSS